MNEVVALTGPAVPERAPDHTGVAGSGDALSQTALAAARGDAAAATAFVQATQRQVWQLVAGLSSPAQADDLTQETYARAFAALPRFAGRSSARTWLLAIARHVCADAIREQRRRKCPQPSVLEAVPERPDEQAAVRAALAGLEPARREAFVLTQLLGLSYTEAGAVCGCPVGTVRSRVARAREDLVRAYRAHSD